MSGILATSETTTSIERPRRRWFCWEISPRAQTAGWVTPNGGEKQQNSAQTCQQKSGLGSIGDLPR